MKTDQKDKEGLPMKDLDDTTDELIMLCESSSKSESPSTDKLQVSNDTCEGGKKEIKANDLFAEHGMQPETDRSAFMHLLALKQKSPSKTKSNVQKQRENLVKVINLDQGLHIDEHTGLIVSVENSPGKVVTYKYKVDHIDSDSGVAMVSALMSDYQEKFHQEIGNSVIDQSRAESDTGVDSLGSKISNSGCLDLVKMEPEDDSDRKFESRKMRTPSTEEYMVSNWLAAWGIRIMVSSGC
jgi:hypothetical protein